MSVLRRLAARRPAGVFQRPAAITDEGQAAPGSPRLADEPTGPLEEGNARAGRARRQLVWWITFAFPYAATVAKSQLSAHLAHIVERRSIYVADPRQCHRLLQVLIRGADPHLSNAQD